MPSQLPKYLATDGVTLLNAAYFNAVFGSLDLRATNLENLQMDWQSAINQLQEFGLNAINAAISENVGELEAIVAEAAAAAGSIAANADALAAAVAEAEAASSVANVAASEASAAVNNAQQMTFLLDMILQGA